MKSKILTACYLLVSGRRARALILMVIGAITLLGLSQIKSAAGTANREPSYKKLRVSDPQLAGALAASGASRIADYGSFQIFRVPEAVALGFLEHPKVEDVTEQNSIFLNVKALDTTRPEILALRTPVAGVSGKRLHLVQFAGPVKPEWQQQLEAHGGTVVTYIPYNTYLIYADGSALSQMQSWASGTDYVQWEGQYLDDYKIDLRARLMDAKGQPQKPDTDTFMIQMVADPAANAETLAVINGLKLEAIRQESTLLGYLNITVRLPAEHLALIAAQPEVISIQLFDEPHKRDERQNQIVAGNLTGTGPSGPGYLAWLTSKGFNQAQFTASGFAVDLSDSGIDNGTSSPGHFGLYPEGDTNLASRVVYNRLEGTPNSGSTILGCDGHGTINSHIICGYNDMPAGFPHTDAAGYRYGLGVCPFVKVGSSVIFDPNTFTSPNIANLQSKAYQDGARISSDSWGANTAGGYNANAQSYDAMVRDAQPSGSTFATAGNQEMVIVFAAGNAGSGAGSVGAPGTAKNVITVGASENVRSMNTASGGNSATGNDGCDEDDTGADNANDIVAFSSRGPCTDLRKKPDLVAPGAHVTGGVAQNSPPNPAGNGSAISCFNATGVCALPGGGSTGNANNFFPLGQQFYTESSGTSHSTPAVAGCCALLRQWFINNSLPPPSPAITKAFLMNSARYLNGVAANDSLWSNNQGMGEANLGFAFDGVSRVMRDQLAIDKFTATGQTRTWTGTISDPTKPFRVTVAWTDAPGSTTGNAYRNDLDLVITVGGITYKGNVFSGASSTTGGTADSRDNVESVFVPAGVTGNYSCTVTAANINSDGVPNEAPSLDQDFAVVIYNAIEVPSPIIAPGGATVSAENCESGNGAADPGETVTMQFSLSNVGTSNTTSLVATLLATNGVSAPSGPQNFGALTVGGGAVTQSFSFTVSGVCGGTISPTLQLLDGTNNLGTVSFSLQLGVTGTLSSENFDAVSVPALPSGWTTTASGSGSAWVTTSSLADTAPNAAFTSDPTTAGESALVSPQLPVPSAGTQLSFRHNYSTESSYDGGVLEIKIGAGAFTDILTAGGSFVSGGYNGTLIAATDNPITGRAAWTGSSSGFITTIVNLPASAIGQAVQFRWRSGADASVGGTGWYVDSVTLTAPVCCGNATAPIASFAAAPLVGAAPLAVTFADASLGPITNRLWNFGDTSGTNTTATNFVHTYSTAGTFSVSVTAQGPYGESTFTRTAYITVTNPIVVLVSNSFSLTIESCPSGGVDPGETVTVSFGLKNVGSANATNLVATLLATGGVSSPSGSQAYGAVASGGGTVTRTFSFLATGTCGGPLTATLQLQDGATSYGTISFSVLMGTVSTVFAQNFDSVSVPALPPSWTTTASGAQSPWVTSGVSNSSPPNAVFSTDAAAAGVNELVSPVFLVPTAGSQLSFRNYYNLEAPTSGTGAYDGGVLEIKIGAGAFTDILTAGGSFVTGGYNRTINTSSDPLNGRQCWSSTSGGYISTLVNLPAAATGQNIQLRWRCGTDSSVSRPGWYVDSVSVTARTCCSASRPVLLNPQVDGSGNFSCLVSGDPGNYLIETSTDLENWSPAGTVTIVSGQISYGYSSALDGFRAFRAKAQP